MTTKPPKQSVPESVGKEFVGADKKDGLYRGKGAKGSTSKRATGKARGWTGK